MSKFKLGQRVRCTIAWEDVYPGGGTEVFTGEVVDLGEDVSPGEPLPDYCLVRRDEPVFSLQNDGEVLLETELVRFDEMEAL